jgi:Domain of unknown function (DUF5103)
MKLIYSPLFLCLFLSLNVLAKPQTEFVPDDKIYDMSIRTVLLYPENSDPMSMMLPPVLPLAQDVPLWLEFDQLSNDTEDYAVKIVNCNADWTVSQLNSNEYLDDYNEFYIRNRELSFNTKVQYVHYRFQIPKVKISGNFVLKIYKTGNENDIIISKRYMIYDPKVSIVSSMGIITGVEEAFRNQQINFNIQYPYVDISNPSEQVKVSMRQNFRWDNAIKDLKPTYVNPANKELIYKYFNLENNFKGGNEYRVFDTRFFQARGINIAQLELKEDKNEVKLMTDQSRNGIIYHRIFDDLNGRYYVQNTNGRDPHTEADYYQVNFRLKAPIEPLGKVYVSGGFSNWQLDPDYEMQYNDAEESYELSLTLKQGYYAYLYSFQQNGQRDDIYYEGSHNMTENNYEIFVYYRPFGARTDYLIGYRLM